MGLSIVIITRNTKDLLQGLLTSIERDIPLKPFLKEVTVIDNYSTDGTDSMVHKEFPWVFLIKNDRNRGFAAAANMGISRSEGEYILFLNSDTLLIEGEVASMVQFMEENPDVGICGPQLVYEDLRLQRSYAHIPSLLFEIVPRFLLELLLPQKYSAKPSGYSAIAVPSESPNLKLKRPASGYPDSEPSSSSLRTLPPVGLDVPSLIGAAIIVRKKLLDDLGGFDERFFFFLEETDLCVRARERGKRVIFLPHIKVVHLQGRTVRKNWVQGRIQYTISLYKFIRKHHTGTYYRIFQGIRLAKSFFVPLGLSVIPFLLLHRRTRRTYVYYLSLLFWHLRGCPSDAGLLVSSPE
jgi:N-acetylglucosaminyl-diphospho-decaprenol L-rhamnosyltransferase